MSFPRRREGHGRCRTKHSRRIIEPSAAWDATLAVIPAEESAIQSSPDVLGFANGHPKRELACCGFTKVDAKQLLLQLFCPPTVITGLDPVMCASTVPREITVSGPVMTKRDAPTQLVYWWASPNSPRPQRSARRLDGWPASGKWEVDYIPESGTQLRPWIPAFALGDAHM